MKDKMMMIMTIIIILITIGKLINCYANLPASRKAFPWPLSIL